MDETNKNLKRRGAWNKNDDNETECENKDFSNAEDDFVEHSDGEERWKCLVCQSGEIMSMCLCRLCSRFV